MADRVKVFLFAFCCWQLGFACLIETCEVKNEKKLAVEVLSLDFGIRSKKYSINDECNWNEYSIIQRPKYKKIVLRNLNLCKNLKIKLYLNTAIRK